ncbi:hypothetical protein LLG46_10720 [bacterium]|nr:hypothetical protein [bacterium]
MTTNLPPRPDLGHLKRQAKSLLKSHQHGDGAACPILRQLYRFANSTDTQILASDVKLNEVQFALALDYGFSSWNAMKHHVEQSAIMDNGIVIHRHNGEVWIDGVPKLSWGNPGQCTFIGALLRALNRIGEPVGYDDLMGLSGAAFRFCFAHPDWDWSCVDGMLGYDHGQAAMDTLGFEGGWAEGESETRVAFVKSIDEGRPALGIDLVRAAEWGVITGYADEGKTLLCRTYFDDPGDDYSRTERLPWLNYLIGERKPPRSRHESLLTSLRIAVTYARGDGFVSGGGCSYKRGLEGLETWISDLLDDSRYDPNDYDSFCKHASINRFVMDSLIDARKSVSRYLANHAEILGSENRDLLMNLAGVYSRIVAELNECEKYAPKGESPAGDDWRPEMRQAQVDSLREVVGFEREALRLCEQILSQNN